MTNYIMIRNILSTPKEAFYSFISEFQKDALEAVGRSVEKMEALIARLSHNPGRVVISPTSLSGTRSIA